MKLFPLAALLFSAAITSASAQTAVGVGTGISSSRAQSASRAVAISGQGGQGGNAQGGNAAATVNIAGTPAQTAVASTSTTTLNGHQRIDTTPQIAAPGLTSSFGSCLGSVSGGGAVTGFGLTFGGTIEDRGCTARQNAQMLWNMKLHQMAFAVMCEQESVYRANPALCQQYLPQAQPAAYAGPGPIFGVSPAPAAVMSAESVEIDNHGPIEVTDGNTGVTKLCNDYDAPGQRCRDPGWHRKAPAPKKRVAVAVQAAPQK